jgi:hypothetical protein
MEDKEARKELLKLIMNLRESLSNVFNSAQVMQKALDSIKYQGIDRESILTDLEKRKN